MEFSDNKPIWLQIRDWMCDRIAGGEWPDGERIPSVRDVGVALQVNPNTVMRAFESMQRDGMIFNRRGVGYFVAEGGRAKVADAQRSAFLGQTLPAMFGTMERLGITRDELIAEYENFKTGKQ